MDQNRSDRAMDPAQVADGCHDGRRRDSPACKADGMQNKSLARDRCGALGDVRCNMHFKPGGVGGACHRQAVQQERPILGPNVEEARFGAWARYLFFFPMRKPRYTPVSASSRPTVPMTI